jgi:uncharacterized repeat protein (TIGR01451 family)
MYIANCAITGNTARDGAGIISHGLLTIDNSTISGNTMYRWGDPPDSAAGLRVAVYGGVSTATLNNTTVTGNSGPSGGGISNDFGGHLTLHNSLVAGNTGSNGSPDCGGTISSAGYNLIGTTAGCTFVPHPGDLVNVEPRLEIPAATSDPAPYQGLVPESPAVDAGDPKGCTGYQSVLLTADQRCRPRFGRCDIGAYELQPLGFSSMAASSLGVQYGEPFTYTITLRNPGTVDLPAVRVTDTLSALLTYLPGSLHAPTGSFGEAGGVITWTGALGAGQETPITFRTQAVRAAQTITNTATIEGGEVFRRAVTVEIIPLRVFLPLVTR